METPLLNYYLELLDFENRPKFLDKYLETASLSRLKGITYLCGMDNASKDVYDFKEYITRFDHSLTVALLTWKCTNSKEQTLAGLIHDIATPCFSHVIDYMNKDYANQESTEKYTEKLIKNDKTLLKYLKEDNINIEDVINFKKYSIVDNDRPKVCADRLDGLILTGIAWTKNINFEDIKRIVEDIEVYKLENKQEEIGFRTKSVAEFVVNINESIDIICHSNEDNYMMELLADITRKAINKNIISYEDLYKISEKELIEKIEMSKDEEILEEFLKFQTIKKSEIPVTVLKNVKARKLNPLVNKKRVI